MTTTEEMERNINNFIGGRYKVARRIIDCKDITPTDLTACRICYDRILCRQIMEVLFS